MLLAAALTGCASPDNKPAAVTAEPVTLIVAGSWEDCKAIEAVGRAFTEQNPECTIVYEYVQDYYDSLEKRMTGESAIDIFFTSNIQADSQMLPYALDLYSRKDFDYSQTFDGLRENFALWDTTPGEAKLYAMPLGAEMRGMYINLTLLKSLGIETPKNQAELLAACEKFKQNGYTALQGNPGMFAQLLLYPWICNIIANADDPKAAYDKVSNREPGLSEMFMEPFKLLYTLVEKGYYDYKLEQTERNMFMDTKDLSIAQCFLNVWEKDGVWAKTDDLGQVAFMPGTMSLKSVVDKVKDDYHSEIEYVFVPAPVGPDGGYAYMSPAHGIAINKASANLDWSVKFIDFLFGPTGNELFAKEFNIVPNTKEAFEYITKAYDIPGDHISHLGQVTFNYNFYGMITQTLTDISKGNNPKYMMQNDDGTVSLYPLEYYTNTLEESIVGNEQQ